MDSKIVVLSSVFLALLAIGKSAAQQDRAENCRVKEVAKEIRTQIREIRQSINEQTQTESNMVEICFRVGNLYQSARHELEEVVCHKLSAAAKRLIEELVNDGKSLPSFCGDNEKAKNDPGYEQIPKGDIDDLQREIANMNRRTKALIEAAQ